MMKLIALFVLLLPISLYSQYTQVWKSDFNYDEKENNSFASKVKIAKEKNLICVSSIGQSKKTMLSVFDLNGNLIKEIRPFYLWLPFNESTLKDRHELFQSENNVNKFDIDILSDKFMYFNVGKSRNNDTSKLFHYSVDFELKNEQYAQNRYLENRHNSFTALLSNGNNLFIADTIWLGFNSGENKIQHYLLKNQTVDPYYFNKPIVLSPDTIKSNKEIANPVPVAIKRTFDSNLVVVIASEEQESTQAIGVSCRIVDKSFQETNRFLLPPEQFNLNGKLLSIKDAKVTKNSIYFVGNVYLYNSSSNALIAKYDLDGSNFKSTLVSNEGSVFKSIEILNDTTVIAVGASKNVTHQSNTHKFLAEFDEKVDLRFTKEWSTTNLDTLYDIERVNDNEFIIVGSEDGFPFMEKLRTNTVSSIQTVPESSRDFGVLLPNPAKYQSLLQLSNSEEMEGSIKLLSIDGKFIQDLYVGSIEEHFQLPFSTINLSNGVYNIVVQTKNKQFFIPFVIGE